MVAAAPCTLMDKVKALPPLSCSVAEAVNPALTVRCDKAMLLIMMEWLPLSAFALVVTLKEVG